MIAAVAVPALVILLVAAVVFSRREDPYRRLVGLLRELRHQRPRS